MKKILISTMLVVAGLGITGTAFAGNPVVQAPCTVNGPVAGQGDDDFDPCVGPGGVVYPARVAAAPPVPPPVGASGPVPIAPVLVGRLPATGSDSNDPLVMGAMALALGGGLVIVAHRRRRQPAAVAA